jgi:pilin isopeptide linkage protein
LSASKTLNNGTLSGNDFSFTLSQKGGSAALQTKSNDVNGTIAFDAITLNEAGTYEYTIAEVAGSANDITYDSNSYDVTVVVAKSATSNALEVTSVATTYGSNNNVTATDGVYNVASFVNTKVDPTATSITLSASKTFNNGTLSGNDFSFTLSQKGESTALQTKSNDADGNIAFDAITLNAAGTYEYTIAEVAGSANDIAYDSHSYDVTVVVAKSATSNALEVTSVATTYGSNNDVTATDGVYNVATFVNTKASKVIDLRIQKTPDDSLTAEDGPYSFTLNLWKDGEAVTAIEGFKVLLNDNELSDEEIADLIQFDNETASFTLQADDVLLLQGLEANHYTYQITETNADDYDVEIRVKGLDIEDVTITANDKTIAQTETPLTESQEIVFQNSLASGSESEPGVPVVVSQSQPSSLTITKVVNNAPANDQTVFHFVVKLLENPAMLISTEAEDSAVEAAAEEATEEATELEGTFDADATTGSAIEFVANSDVDEAASEETNASEEISEQADVNGFVPYTGSYVLNGETYAYDDTTGIVLTLKNGETVTIGELPLNVAYEIVEVDIPENYVDQTNGLEGMMEEDGVVATYTNSYNKPADNTPSEKSDRSSSDDGTPSTPSTSTKIDTTPATVTVYARKTLDGAVPADGRFTFLLKDEQGSVLQSKQNVNGLITFDEMDYTKVGSYRYTVTEEIGSDASINYDGQSYQIVITVTKDAAQKLHADVAYYLEDGSRCDVLAFANTTKPAIEEEPSDQWTERPGVPVDDGVDLNDPNTPTGWRDGENPDGTLLPSGVPQTGDQTQTAMWAILMLLAALGCCIAVMDVTKKRW